MFRSYHTWVGAGLFRRSSNSKLTLRSERRTHPAEHSRARKPGAGPANAAIKASVIVFSILVTPCLKVKAQIIDLGAAQDVTILGASTVTNTGPTIITGNLALSPGSAITGFPPGTVQGGTIHINDALANQAHADAFTAYTTLAGEASSPANNLTGQDLGGKTLAPGVYHFNTSAQLTGTLDLNTSGNPNAVFHFQIGSTLTTASNSAVVLLGIAGSDPNIFWQVGSSATIGTGTLFQGNILALTSITFNTGASLTGRALAINGAVTLDANSINGGAATTGAFWNGGSTNLWSGTNWSPDATGATTNVLAPNSDVVFSVTGILPHNQNTTLDSNTTIASLTVNDPVAVTISGPFTLSISGTDVQAGITVNPGAGLVTINSPLELSGLSQGITVNNSAGLVINGPVGGAIGLTKLGVGTLTLTAAETYTGPTLVSAGTLQLGNGTTAGTSISSSNSVTINPAATLALNLRSTEAFANDVTDNGIFAAIASGTNTISGVISGTGVFTKAGPGEVVLAGLNTYSGGTILSDGILTVDSPQALGTGDMIVKAGILRADPQPINVKGNYIQDAAGTLQLNVAGAAPGQYDTLNVGGNAALGGTLQLLSLGFIPKSGNLLTLVSTGGAVSGQFAQFIDPFAHAPGIATVELLYQTKAVELLFLGLTPIPGLGPGSILNSSYGADTVEGLTALYEISFSNANIQRLTLEDRLDDIRNGSNGFSSNMKVNSAPVERDEKAVLDGKSAKNVVEPVLQRSPQNPWGVWVTGFGDFVSVDSDANARGYDFTTGGFSLGIDYRLTDFLAIGAMGEYSHTWTSLEPSGHVDVNSGRGGIYATLFSHGFYLNSAIYGGHNNYDSGRASAGGIANGSTEGTEWSTFASGGYDFHVGNLSVGPIASLQYTNVHIDGFSENGSFAPLSVSSGSAESLRSDLGFRAFYLWQIGKILVIPSLRAAWQHEYKYSVLPITAGFAGIPGPSATFFGPSEGHDSAIVSAGISVRFTPAISAYLSYDGQLARSNYSSNAVTGGVRISF